ncbi:peptidase inhibitor family I36 protein [Nonomuraea jiangxiensis]|uniref:Peptidase inhibitor family I36 n=1 Tax=Nonomuraea jiangxiensis TaxID=633440 RepID=A0A1G9IQC3_9ACTN|nr:peptidase inhibitor family I36 protein [Nonomuraea jiangxiensis]SDL27479.1 Peptidase inhibitor family I36 [Nonomuraea jiangxiensis]
MSQKEDQPTRLMKALKTAGIVISAGVIVGSGFTALPAQAAVNSTLIDTYLAAVPNGTKLSANEASWEGGTVRLVMSATEASCPDGWYCVYQYKNWRGAMAKWRTSPARCKKFNFNSYWRDKISSFWARGDCRDYFLKDKKAFQPDPFQSFAGKHAYVLYDNRYDYAARGL